LTSLFIELIDPVLSAIGWFRDRGHPEPQLKDNVLVKLSNKPIRFGRAASLLLLPLLPLAFLAAAMSIPYTKIRRSRMARREGSFAESMKLRGRVMEWADFIGEVDRGNGMLIVERFSFKGPIRLWWTRDNLYKTCPYPLVDWFTMANDTTFDPVRDWCHTKYTGVRGEAMLVTGTEDQWRSIGGDEPFTFRDGVQFVEVPPPRRS
jgi:hypothetical protein